MAKTATLFSRIKSASAFVWGTRTPYIFRKISALSFPKLDTTPSKSRPILMLFLFYHKKIAKKWLPQNRSIFLIPNKLLLVHLLYQVRTYFQNKWCRTRGARGEAKLNRTLGERPATASQSLGRTPKRKMSFPFSKRIGRAQIRKARNIFLFGVAEWSEAVAGLSFVRDFW